MQDYSEDTVPYQSDRRISTVNDDYKRSYSPVQKGEFREQVNEASQLKSSRYQMQTDRPSNKMINHTMFIEPSAKNGMGYYEAINLNQTPEANSSRFYSNSSNPEVGLFKHRCIKEFPSRKIIIYSALLVQTI